MSSVGGNLLSSASGSYGIVVFFSWITVNRLQAGILFQKPVYVFALFGLVGVALAHLVLFAFPNAKFAAEGVAALGVSIGAAQMHKKLLERVQSPKKWNLAISAIWIVFFVVLLLSNI